MAHSNKWDDAELMKRFNSGDVRAIDVIFNMYFINLAFFAKGLIKQEDDAKDIAITAIESVIQKGEKLTIRNLKAYLYRIVKNRCIDYLHQKKKSQIDALDEEIPNNEYIEAQIVRTEFLNEVYAEIESLTPARKQVLKMLFVENMTIPEICAKLKTTRMLVYNNKLRAMKQLMEAIKLKKLMP